MKIKVINSGKSTSQKIQALDPCPFVIDMPPDATRK